MSKKIELGQFFTEENSWIHKHIKDFIKDTNPEVFYDPFAGTGCLLKQLKEIYPDKNISGLDIDESFGWTLNDSLKFIPVLENSLIVTNPPYLKKTSAKRKGINLDYDFKDLYLLALQKIIETGTKSIDIVPETFINSGFRKDILNSITILERNPFKDTEVPVVVLCFDMIPKDISLVKVYKDSKFVCYLDVLKDIPEPSNKMPIKFNDKYGWLGVRCIDLTSEEDQIHFDYKEKIDYDWSSISGSSRHYTSLNLNIPKSLRDKFIESCNRNLKEIRERTFDICLSPFKGNRKDGKRRRRLDYKLCRAILEKAYEELDNFSGSAIL